MKLERLYRDIFSSLRVDREEIPIYSLDVVNCINDTISELIREYAGAGIGDVFSVTVNINDFEKDENYPFVFSSELEKAINQDVDIYTAIYSSYFKGADDLVDDIDSAEKGDIKYKDGLLYECIEDFNDVNTFNLTFDPSRASEFFPENDLIYKEGTVTYDVASKTWWIATEDYTNDSTESIDQTGAFEQLYWKLIGFGDFEGNHVNQKKLNSSRLSNDINDYFIFNIQNKKIYANTQNSLVLTYIPEWEYVEDLDADLDIPESTAFTIKQRCVQYLAPKLGVATEENEG